MRKILVFLTVMSMVYLADATLADFVPGFLEKIMGNSLYMGLIISCSSLAGITMDLLFAQLLKNTSVKRMMLIPIMGAFIFAVLLLAARAWPVVLLLLLGMIVWGIYYEFFGFAAQQYVVEVAPPHGRASAWGVVEMVKCSAYMLGPLVGAKLASYGDEVVLYGVMITLIIAYSVIISVKIPSKPVVVELREIDLVAEVGHWKVLIEHIWPILTVSVFLGILDSFFWTSGALLTDKLAKEHWLGGYFLSVYMLPSLFVGGLVAKLELHQHKKKIALGLLFISGIILANISVIDSIYWYLAIVFLSSCFSAAAWPLVDAVYTDLLSRLGRERKHMIGLNNSTMSLAYVVGPSIAGLLTYYVGEVRGIASWGLVVAVVCLILFFVIPKKLLLPQTEIRKWEL